MRNWDINKKWLMVNQDRQAEILASSTSLYDSSENAATKDLKGARTAHPIVVTPSSSTNTMRATNRSSTTSSSGSSGSNSTRSSLGLAATTASTTTTTIPAAISTTVDHLPAGDRNSPEYFIRKFMEPSLRAVTPAVAANLEVSLRTRPIE